MATSIFVITILMVALLLGQNFDLIAASKPLQIQPPVVIHKGSLSKPKPPSTATFTIKRYKRTESSGGGDAFRPTSPGHSPGVGNHQPPSTLL
ncbi:hypothetical protein C1H46_016092 [Malus baccata]|uniref:Uncharacterized protein n=1 Tax=Malus baccata TaxID=106549 RepID=A0A540MHQ0_MALBA|nr:hypothetical protein C1H46_016092 [Malus baccata]